MRGRHRWARYRYRLDLTAWSFARRRAGRRIVRRRVGYLRLHWYSMAWTANGGRNLRHGPSNLAGLGAPLQRRGTGRASQSQIARSGSKLTVRQQANWPSLSRPARPRCTGWCVGGGSICATNCSGASVSRYMSVRSGRFDKLGYRKLSVRPRHPQADEEARKRLKKLCRDSRGANPRPRQKQADRSLVPDAMRTG